MNNALKPLQLLAPARDYATGIEAILHGADAVYIGPEAFGARQRAGNSIEDIRRLVEFAHPYGVRIYATVNTIIYDHELEDVCRMAWDLYHAGVDALIVQDMAFFELELPPIALHASTQCDTRTAEKARFLADCGVTQIVLPRELSVDEISDIAKAVWPVRIEAFVHGALCVSYSGDCRASWAVTGRSANRGECAQMCRLPYDLIDGDGKKVGRTAHYLSLRDMNRMDYLADMAEAGVSSFKIEGRLKDVSYVKNVVTAYRRALDRLIARYPDRYCRASRGESKVAFEPQLQKVFSRGFTPYFITGERPGQMASMITPKAVGEEIGRVKTCRGKSIECRLKAQVNNGDGIIYVTPDGSTGGFRVNRAESGRLLLNQSADIPAGSVLYRNYDKQFADVLNGVTAERRINCTLRLYLAGDGMVCLDGTIGGETVTVTTHVELQPADKPDGGRRAENLKRLGDSIFEASGVTDEVGEMFIPASVISGLRRDLCRMMHVWLMSCYKREEPGKKKCDATWQHVPDFHDNISNRLSASLYRRATGYEGEMPMAVECREGRQNVEGLEVMCTRYCLRRELGACLRTPEGVKLKEPLTLRGAGFSYGLKFDCANCKMRVFLK